MGQGGGFEVPVAPGCQVPELKNMIGTSWVLGTVQCVRISGPTDRDTIHRRAMSDASTLSWSDVTIPLSETASIAGSVPEAETTEEREGDDGPNHGGMAAAATGAVAGAVVGGATAAPIAVAGVQAIGFGASGIASASTAAAIMSAEAIAAGGGVAAGGTTATLQSVGATASLGALGAGSVAIIAFTGAIAGASLLGGAAYLTYKFTAHKPDGQEPEQTEGMKLGKWMVMTEEGINNVRFYRFETQDLAWRYFNDAWNSRIILNEHGEEQAAAGWNGAAIGNCRMQIGVSPHNSATGFCPLWLEAGKVIALHNAKHNRFIRMMGEAVDSKGGPKDLHDLPAEWGSERFTLVNAGNGEFALHSAVHNRFVRMVEDAVDAKGGTKAVDELPASWDAERFTIVDAGNGLVALHSTTNNRFVKMDGDDVNGKAGRRDAVSLPNAWDTERFTVKFA